MSTDKNGPVRFLIEICECQKEYYWRLFNDKDEIVAVSHKWYKSRSECIHAINIIGHQFKNAVVSEEVVFI